MQTLHPSLTLTVSSVMSSRCAVEDSSGWVRAELVQRVGLLHCMSCAQPRRDSGNAVIPDGVAGQALGWRGGGEEVRGWRAWGLEGSWVMGFRLKRFPHLESLQVSPNSGHERWDQAPGRGKGDRVWHWTYHSQGSVIRKTTKSRKENK